SAAWPARAAPAAGRGCALPVRGRNWDSRRTRPAARRGAGAGPGASQARRAGWPAPRAALPRSRPRANWPAAPHAPGRPAPGCTARRGVRYGSPRRGRARATRAPAPRPGTGGRRCRRRQGRSWRGERRVTAWRGDAEWAPHYRPAARGDARDGPSALVPGGEEGQLAPARQLLEPPLRARSAGAIRIRAAGQQPQRTAPAGVARTRAVGMGLQARGPVVADAGVPGAVAAFEQVEPPAAVGGGVHGRDGRSANAVGGWYRRSVRRRGTWKGGHRPPRNGGGPPGEAGRG